MGDLLGCVLLQHGGAERGGRVLDWFKPGTLCIEGAGRGDRAETSTRAIATVIGRRSGARSALGGFTIDSSSMIVASSVQAR